jgi:hypothetical protein
MYLNTLIKNSAFLLLLAAVLVSGCGKEKSNRLTNEDDNGGYASDISRVEWADNDALSIVDAAGFFYNGAFIRTTNGVGVCADVATDTLSNPHVLTIRFGTNNCLCLDGRNRRGNIVVTYDGDFRDTGEVKTITFDRYYVNDRQLTGEMKVIRVDTTILGNWYYKVKVNTTLINTDNKHTTWQGGLVRKWLAGYETGDRNDNVYIISGSATLTRSNGHIFGCDIATPLHVAMDCDYIRTGVVNVNAFEGLRVLNYGSGSINTPGSCDADAQINIGLNVYQVKL